MSDTGSVSEVGWVRFADIAIVVMAAPFAVAFGAPALGVAVGVGAWALMRALGAWLDRRTAAQDDPRRALGIGFASSLGRVWVLALSILAVGTAASHSDGLAAALVILVSFTINLAMNLLLHRSDARTSRGRPSAS